MKTFFKFVAIVLILIQTSCVSILYPRKQKIIINTKDNNAKVYVDNRLVGKGRTVTTRVRKQGTKQVVVESPNKKTNYYVLVPQKRTILFWPLYLCNITNLYGFLLDPMAIYGVSYQKENAMSADLKNAERKDGEKYITLESIKLDIKDKDKDLKDFILNYSKELNSKIQQVERKRENKEKKKEERKKRKGKIQEFNNDKEVKYDNTRFSDDIIKTLKELGYIDTLNKVFHDNVNTIQLEGKIKQASIFNIYGKLNSKFYRGKVEMVWYIKNTYGELYDSLKNDSYSGDFCVSYENINNKDAYDDVFYKMFSDAVDNNFLDILTSSQFKKHLKVEKEEVKLPLLTLPVPTNLVSSISDATIASVIVKRGDGGHGSGFAVSNDGYIITNYHVIAGDKLDKQEKVSVILQSGNEIPATVVRFNKAKDIALLKVDNKFEKSFKLSNQKTYKNFMDVYTIGAPQSVELGQTVSKGIISNERTTNNEVKLQLSMSTNFGNSGGPLFDQNGTLHGVITSKLVGFATEGISFAVPSYLINDYLNVDYNK